MFCIFFIIFVKSLVLLYVMKKIGLQFKTKINKMKKKKTLFDIYIDCNLNFRNENIHTKSIVIVFYFYRKNRIELLI